MNIHEVPTKSYKYRRASPSTANVKVADLNCDLNDLLG